MEQEAEIPDVRFWGMVVKANKPATYSIENEHGLMELCHVTNVALVSKSEIQKPIYVRVLPSDHETEYVLGALVPGRIYSFQTDLLILPDTQFSHSGSKDDEVHLTGYRSINVDSVMLDEDDDDDEDEEDEEDAAFIADSDAEEGDEEEEEEARNGRTRRKKQAHRGHDAAEDDKVAQVAARNIGVLKRRLLPIGVPGDDLSDSNDAEFDPAASSGSDDDDEDSGEKMQTEERRERLDSDSESSESDEDEAADPAAKAAAVAKAQKRREEVEREKSKQPQGPAPAPDAQAEQIDNIADKLLDTAPRMKQTRGMAAAERETHPAKKAKVDHKDGAGAHATGKKSKSEVQHAHLGVHPEGVSDDTKQYAADVVSFLRKHDGRFSMSKIGTLVQRPENALKVGGLLKKYNSWFRRSGEKGQEELVLLFK